jgi:murein DD-endopeptidase MepM/ murein hydrolase activator NlpD
MRFNSNGIFYEAVMIHMKENSVNVNIGDTLVPGQPIGEVNSTGNSFGNHLHFQIYELTTIPPEPLMPGEKPRPVEFNKNAIDPLSIMGNESCQKQG